MDFLIIFVIALALSMDAAAVTICNTMAAPHTPWRKLILMPVFFGFFQGFMPFLGYFAGDMLSGFVGDKGGIIVGIVLGLIGLHMIRESFEQGDSCDIRQMDMRLLLVQAVATSIDALAVGVSFGAAGVPLIATVLIGVVTFIAVLLAIMLGKAFGQHLGNRAQILGGVLLLLVALKSFFS